MFKGNLYKTQAEAAEFLANKRKALLAWEQGTGKTVISLATAERLFSLGKAKNALILAPTGIAWQWEDKIREFTDSTVSLTTAADKDSRKYAERREANRYLIVPWSLFRNDYTSLCKLSFDIIIADEAQEFKNNASKTAKLIKRLNRRRTKATYRWALTGTAISNKLEELYSILQWVDNKFLPTWAAFERRHIVRSEATGIVIRYKDLGHLYEYLKTRVNRKTQADLAGELPELVEQVHKIPKSKEYIKAEKSLLTALSNWSGNISFDSLGRVQTEGHDPAIAKAFSKVQQQVISSEKLVYATRLTESILAENPSNRVVIFCRFKEPLYSLERVFRGRGRLFTGDQTSDAKRAAIRDFKTSSRILLASNAGAAGLDLPFANYIIHLDVPFSHGILDQRNKRITRIGSSFSTAVVNYCIVQDSIEDYYYQVVKNKKRLADAVLEGTEDHVTIRPGSLSSFIKKDIPVL